MERGLILLVAALMVFIARAAAILSFSNEVVNVTRTGCGTTQLCVETPEDCDPAANSSCLFASVIAGTPMAPNGTNLNFSLSGESTGYIALGLTMNASTGTTMLFLCLPNPNDNSTILFQTMDKNNINMTLTTPQWSVTGIRGLVQGNKIQCQFTVVNANATSTRASEATTFNILLGNGTLDGTTPGPFNTILASGLLDVTNPASNTATTTLTTVTATTGSSVAVQPHVLLVLLSVLTLPLVLKA